MLGFVLRGILILGGGLWVLIVLLRLQPLSGDLRVLLADAEVCDRLCLLGIIPGQTTAAEALTLLEAHAWVGTVDTSYYNPERWPRGVISWGWSGRQPSLIDGTQAGSLEVTLLPGQAIQQVYTVHLPVRLSLATLVLTLGEPDQSWLAYDGSSVFRSLNSHNLIYHQDGLAVRAGVVCPVSVRGLAQQRVYRLSASVAYADTKTAPVQPLALAQGDSYFSEYYLPRSFPRYQTYDLSVFPGCARP